MFTNNISQLKNKLKLETKKLNSGKYQVKFYVLNSESDNKYGYLLAEADMTLKEVVFMIHDSLSQSSDYRYLNLINPQEKNEILFF